MPLGTVLVHTATVKSTVVDPDEETWVEGEPDEKEVTGPVFACFLQLTTTSEEQSPMRRRRVEKPTLMYEPEDEEGNEFSLAPEDELLIVAEELTGTDPVLWQVDGEPTPMAPPGYVVGYQAKLKRVVD
jgi:hypothetical protein